MSNYFINSGIIVVLYVLMKFAEMKFILKENKPLKPIIREGVIVYISSLIGMYIIEMTQDINISNKGPTSAFIGNPEF